MAAKKKKSSSFLKILLGFFIFLIAAAVLVTLFVDLDGQKPRIEAMASEASGMDVRFAGSLDLRLLPMIAVRANGPSVSNQGSQLFAAEYVTVNLQWGALLRGRVEPAGIHVQAGEVTVVRNEDGTFNFEVPGGSESAGPRPAVAVFNISLADLVVRFQDRADGFSIEAAGCDIDIDHLMLAAGAPPERVMTEGSLACERVVLPSIEVTELAAELQAGDGRIALNPMTAQLFGGQAEGFVGADFSGAQPTFEIDYRLAAFQLEAFLENLAPQSRASGQLDLLARITTQGTEMDGWRRNASGEVSLSGRDLDLIGVNLDERLAQYQESQSFNLVDAGAFFFAGPLGVAVTKGHDFSRMLVGASGQTRITHLVSEWQLRSGIAEARDVAFATLRHRLALQGRLDFVSQRFDGLTVGLLDERGCARARQTLSGRFNSPRVDAPSFLSAISAPVRGLLGRARDLIGGGRQAADGECEVFYNGAVAAPTPAPAEGG